MTTHTEMISLRVEPRVKKKLIEALDDRPISTFLRKQIHALIENQQKLSSETARDQK